jgi:hypothetical protein
VTRRKDSIAADEIGEIHPDRIYRTTLSPIIFGFGPVTTREKIRTGELPPPSPLSASSKAEAWRGAQIIAHRKKMEELAAARLEAKRESERVRVEQGIRRPQPPALVGKKHIKKVKLRPPGASRKAGVSS